LLKRYDVKDRSAKDTEIIKANHIISWKVTDAQRWEEIVRMTEQSAPKSVLELKSPNLNLETTPVHQPV
jgi:hypothetical protein